NKSLATTSLFSPTKIYLIINPKIIDNCIKNWIHCMFLCLRIRIKRSCTIHCRSVDNWDISAYSLIAVAKYGREILNVHFHHARAEEFGGKRSVHRERYDLVTARAVA